jgi:TfoX/Sxy family transcriptional regulator of competence genes
MAYDEEMANRVRECLQAEPNLSEKRMFGGLAFLVNGNMAISVSRLGGLLVRGDPSQADSLLARPHVQQAVLGGREVKGWVRVDPEGLQTNRTLATWVSVGLDYARTRPAK